MKNITQNDEQVRKAVYAKYAQVALQVLGSPCCGLECCTDVATDTTQSTPEAHASSSCCTSSCCTTDMKQRSPITLDLYNDIDLGAIPVSAALASLGCGNPTALAELKPGEYVLDLGSGGGIDVLLSARRVGSTGFVYGLDMTEPMLELAEHNRKETGIENVRFLKGVIEAIPLPDESVNVVISNCVINLSTNKRQVLQEAFRVLTPGGRFAVSDIVIQGDLPPALHNDMKSWTSCIAGALQEETYRTLLQAAGFTDIEIEVTRRYALDDIVALSPLEQQHSNDLDGHFISAFVRARKPEH